MYEFLFGLIAALFVTVLVSLYRGRWVLRLPRGLAEWKQHDVAMREHELTALLGDAILQQAPVVAIRSRNNSNQVSRIFALEWDEAQGSWYYISARPAYWPSRRRYEHSEVGKTADCVRLLIEGTIHPLKLDDYSAQLWVNYFYAKNL